MIRRHGVLVPMVALLLGVFAIIFSFTAYATRIKGKTPSVGLGIVAALLILAEQIVIRFATKCFCCCGQRFSTNWTVITSLLLFICSWLAFFIAFVGLIYTAMLNNRSYLAKTYPGKNGEDCYMGNEKYFLGEAFWCLISTVLGLISYTLWVHGTAKTNDDNSDGTANPDQGVAMGGPSTLQQKEQF